MDENEPPSKPGWAASDKETLLREANEWAAELRAKLVRVISPADSSPTHKVPFKVRVLRELLLHRVSDLSDGACLHYNKGSAIPALVLTRAAFETMALMYYFDKILGEAIVKGDPGALDAVVMKGLFGTKDKRLKEDVPEFVYEAVNILTALDHLEKQYPGLKDMFSFLCEFAHPNHLGVMGGYQQPLTPGQLGNPHLKIGLGPEAAIVPPEYGLICLRIAIGAADLYCRELAAKDTEVRRICEGEKRRQGATSSADVPSEPPR